MNNNTNIFQIFLCDDEWLDWNLSNCSNIFKEKKQKIFEVYPDCNYQLYTNETVKEFLFEFDKDVFNCFNFLKPFAFRADLVRYCLLYKYGGWYFDISLSPLFKFQTNRNAVLFFNSNKKLIENGIIYSNKRHLIMEKVIEYSVKNIKNRYYGEGAIDITGPQALTCVFNALPQNIKKDMYYGAYKYHNYNDTKSARWYEINGTKYSNYKTYEHMCSISHLGFNGTNNYYNMWLNNDVYN
jgi:mannosyltransferase OCH1-like enzyme